MAITNLTHRIAQAFKDCDLDCSSWDYEILLELAQIALRAAAMDPSAVEDWSIKNKEL